MNNEKNVNMLDPNKFFTIGGQVVNIRQREYNGNITKYLMVEDATNPDYPNQFEVEFYRDKAELVNEVKVGDFITANINFNGRKWEKDGEIKGAFLRLKAWKVEVGNQQGQAGGYPQPQPQGNTGFYRQAPAAQVAADVSLNDKFPF